MVSTRKQYTTCLHVHNLFLFIKEILFKLLPALVTRFSYDNKLNKASDNGQYSHSASWKKVQFHKKATRRRNEKKAL